MKQEIELKYQISCLADFKRLLATLRKQTQGPINTLLQKNIFFDTPALELRKHLISLRLRRENKVYYLCVKQSGFESGLDQLSVRLEYESKISQKIADLVLTQQISPLEVFSKLESTNNLSAQLKKLAPSGVHIIGYFLNTRTIVPVILNNKKVIIELDQTTYPDKSVVFEMEIEFKSQEEAWLIRPLIENILKELGIITTSSTPKSDRLYRILFG